MKNKIKINSVCSLLLLLFGCSSEQKKITIAEQATVTDTLIVNDTTQAPPAISTNTTPQKDISGIEFGYCNEEGKQILLLRDSLIDPQKLVKVISDSGKIADILFVKKRAATKEDNNRKTYFNFTNAGGYLYEVKNTSVDKELSLVLVSDEFLSHHKIVNPNGCEKMDLVSSIKTKIEKDKNRKIKKTKCLKQIDFNRSIYLFEFVIKKDSALVTLAYIDNDKIIYHDYPALYNEISTWRVDDGGEFGLDYLNVLAIFENKNNIELVLDWAGAEGYSIDYLVEENSKFVSKKGGYRYCAPD
ncbi:MAG: hypothetical protein H0W73_19845 [Bacteroidetes bacterium]|nr:hypothetical protein [Bacteroidota bacterium]